MKVTANLFRVWLTVCFVVLAFPQSSRAQGSVDAITFYPPTNGFSGNTIGFYNGGVGWSFVPTSDIWVTAISSSAPQMQFWLGTNQVISTYGYTGSNGNFQAIQPMLLSQGNTYFISSEYSNFASVVTFNAYSSQGQDGMAIFAYSSNLSNFGNYLLSPSGQWIPNPSSPLNTDYLYVGPNFQFQAVPEPTNVELSLLAVGVWYIRRQTASSYSHVRKVF
jgi:hypothetical protein